MARRINFLRNALAAAYALALVGAAPVTSISGATNATILWVDVPGYVAQNKEVEIRNRDRAFLPEVSIVPMGAMVRFPNDDTYYHSIYSDNGPNPFDIGYYGNGPGKLVAMSKTGVTIVHCHIHARMFAAIAVVDGPYAQSDKGRYSIAGVAAGTYTLHAWSRDKGEHTMRVTVGANGLSQEVML